MYASGGVTVLQGAYCGSTKCRSEHVCTTHIKHGIYTTCLFKTPIQHTNWEIKNKEKLCFIEGIQIRHIYLDRDRIQFILTHKTNKSKRKGSGEKY